MRIHGRVLLLSGLAQPSVGLAFEQADQVAGCCSELATLAADDDVPVGYSPAVREWWLKLLAEDPEDDAPNWRAGIVAQCLAFCPFCGAQLPASLREEWFDVLESNGVDDPLAADELPDEFLSDRWWKERKL